MAELSAWNCVVAMVLTDIVGSERRGKQEQILFSVLYYLKFHCFFEILVSDYGYSSLFYVCLNIKINIKSDLIIHLFEIIFKYWQEADKLIF